MIQVTNKIIPFGGFKAMALWPFLFIRGDKRFTDTDLRHEEIHGAQQKEMLLVGFFFAYVVCWLIELVRCACDKERGQINVAGYKRRNYIHRVEHSIIFEREAYTMQGDEWYLERRTLWAWTHF